MGATKTSIAFDAKNVAPKLPHLEQDSSTEDAAASFFVVFDQNVLSAKISSENTLHADSIKFSERRLRANDTRAATYNCTHRALPMI